MAVTPDGRKLYVANGRSNSVSVIDTQRLEAISEIRSGIALGRGHPLALQAGARPTSEHPCAKWSTCSTLEQQKKALTGLFYQYGSQLENPLHRRLQVGIADLVGRMGASGSDPSCRCHHCGSWRSARPLHRPALVLGRHVLVGGTDALLIDGVTGHATCLLDDLSDAMAGDTAARPSATAQTSWTTFMNVLLLVLIDFDRQGEAG
jgi:YVTN family beta-propeller protein